MLSDEQISQIKKQLLEQVENFPEDKKQVAKQQIETMNSDQLEQFLVQNNLIQNFENPDFSEQCIFCSIVNGKIPSTKIAENEEAIAILEINPISKGHILIIPKEHSSKISKSISSFAEKISKQIKIKLKPKEIKTFESELFGHKILNLLPIYKNENQNSPRQKSKIEDLKELKTKLEIKPEKPKKKPPIKKPEPEKIIAKDEKIRLPKRIP